MFGDGCAIASSETMLQASQPGRQFLHRERSAAHAANFRVLGRYGVLVIQAQFFVQLFSRAQAGNFDLDVLAGLKAGHTYNTWPLMDGRLVPEGLGQLAPWYLNVFENVTTVQFDHRMVAYLVVALALWHVVALKRSADDERLIGSAGLLAVVLLAQMAVGIATLVLGVPITLGLAHQAGAASVIAAATLHLHGMTRAASRA